MKDRISTPHPGKASTWNHYAMAVKAHFAVAKISKFFNDGSGIAANQRDAWREAQLAIYNHFVLTGLRRSCSDHPRGR